MTRGDTIAGITALLPAMPAETLERMDDEMLSHLLTALNTKQPQRSYTLWTPDMVDLLGTDHDKTVAARLGISQVAVTNKRIGMKIKAYQEPYNWPEKAIQMLGKDTDAAIARKLGIKRATVARKRAALGIPPHEGRKGGRQSSFPKDAVPLLGTMSDRDLAIRLGVPKQAVTYQRMSRRIKPFGRGRN